jgi:predicted nucleotidyltransferase component of viral defense system
MFDEEYIERAALVIRVLRSISKEKIFALKGGTAINFFVRDMPRLSEDIDLNYVPFDNRETAFINIEKALLRVKEEVERNNIKVIMRETTDKKLQIECYKGRTKIKIDMNYDARGYIFKPIIMKSTHKIMQMYGAVETQVVSFPELYAGKISAAMSRQHPRDLFDTKILLENEGITKTIKDAFIVNILTHRKPLYTLLNPNSIDQEDILKNKFEGMSNIEFTYKDHHKTLEKLKDELHHSFTENDKDFIVSFYSLKPQWDLVDIPNIKELPAVKRKEDILTGMPEKNLKEQVIQLKEIFTKYK